jgi:DNA polymerase beta
MSMQCLQTNLSVWSRRVKALKLIDAGLTNIAELRLPQYKKMLTYAQRVGVQYLDHLEKPVTREEAESVAVRESVHLSNTTRYIFRQEAIRLNISAKYEVIIAGS